MLISPPHPVFLCGVASETTPTFLLDVFQVSDACPPTDLQRFLPQLEPLQLEPGLAEGLLPEQLHFLQGRSYPGEGEHNRPD